MRCMHSHFFFKRRVAAAAVELKAPRATVPASLSLAAAGCICICICICNYIGASKKPGKKQRFPCKEFRTFAAIHPSHPPIPATHVIIVSKHILGHENIYCFIFPQDLELQPAFSIISELNIAANMFASI